MAEPLQIEHVRQIEAEMRSLMLSTDRCNRESAESAVKALYKSIGRNAPESFVWFPSPVAAAPAVMLCILAESATMQVNSVGSAAHAKLKISDVWNDAPPAVDGQEEEKEISDSNSDEVGALDDSLYPLTPAWRGWLGNIDLNENSICFARRIVSIPQFFQNESRGAYGSQIPRLFLSAGNVQRTISRAVRMNLTRKLLAETSFKFFDETIEYLNNELFNSPFFGELTRAVETVKRLSPREQTFVLECLFNFVLDVPARIDDTIVRFRFGQHDVDIANRLVVGNLVGLPLGTDPKLFSAVARTCGWWCPLANICVMVDRPTEIHFDNKDVLHSTDGPACRYEDGWGFFALGGIQVSMTAALGQFDISEIHDEINAERKRVMIERYGVAEFLRDSGAQPISEDECGRLFRMHSSMMQEEIQVVEVRNSTPEPDGSYKMYYLRVPPRINSAREAVAWTFGLEQYEYDPDKES